MGLETASFVSNLVATNPVAGDTKSQGDDHLRLIKAALQATFPNASKAFYFPDSAAKTIAYAVVAADMLKFLTGDATAGAFAFTLPTLAVGDAGWRVIIMKIDASANAVTITGTVNGSANPTLTRRYEAAILWWTGTAWFMARQRPTIDTIDITALAITTATINDLAITTAKLADANVTTAKIADLNVTTGKIADGAITAAKLAGARMTIQALTTVGAAQTYTTPANCHTVLFWVVGSGAGGGAAVTGNGGDGGNTTFNGVVANGGKGGVAGFSNNAALGGTAGTGSATVRFNGSAGSPGQNGADNTCAGSNGAPGIFGTGAGRGTTGAGGNGADGTGAGGASGGGSNTGGGGGAGEQFWLLISAPAASYVFTITAGGTAGSGSGSAGGVGGNGGIYAFEFY